MTPNEYLQQGRWQYISGGSTLLNSGEINCQSPDKLKAKVWTPKQLTHLPPLKPSHPGGSRVRCRAGCRSGLRRHASCFHGCSCSCRNRQSARWVEQNVPLGYAEGNGTISIESDITNQARVTNQVKFSNPVTLATIRSVESGDDSDTAPPSASPSCKPLGSVLRRTLSGFRSPWMMFLAWM